MPHRAWAPAVNRVVACPKVSVIFVVVMAQCPASWYTDAAALAQSSSWVTVSTSPPSAPSACPLWNLDRACANHQSHPGMTDARLEPLSTALFVEDGRMCADIWSSGQRRTVWFLGDSIGEQLLRAVLCMCGSQSDSLRPGSSTRAPQVSCGMITKGGIIRSVACSSRPHYTSMDIHLFVAYECWGIGSGRACFVKAANTVQVAAVLVSLLSTGEDNTAASWDSGRENWKWDPKWDYPERCPTNDEVHATPLAQRWAVWDAKCHDDVCRITKCGSSLKRESSAPCCVKSKPAPPPPAPARPHTSDAKASWDSSSRAPTTSPSPTRVGEGVDAEDELPIPRAEANDVIVANTGLHMAGGGVTGVPQVFKSLAPLQAALSRALELSALRRRVYGASPTLFWRQTTPQHFFSKDGGFDSKMGARAIDARRWSPSNATPNGCIRFLDEVWASRLHSATNSTGATSPSSAVSPQPLADSVDMLVRNARASNSSSAAAWTIIPAWWACHMRGADHVGVWRPQNVSSKIDCTHFCEGHTERAVPASPCLQTLARMTLAYLRRAALCE